MTYTTPEGIGYRANVDEGDMLLWRTELVARDYVLEEIIAPPPGKSMEIWGIFVETGWGTVRVYLVAPDGSAENLSDSSVSALYVMATPFTVEPGGHLAVTSAATLTGTPWVHAFGHIV